MDPWTISSHLVLTVSELLQICKDNGTIAECDILEIAFVFEGWKCLKPFRQYLSHLEQIQAFADFRPKIKSAVDSSPAKQLALPMNQKFIEDGKQVVFCNVRGGEIFFVRRVKLLIHVNTRGKAGSHYLFTDEYVEDTAMIVAPQGHRFISISTYIKPICDPIDRNGRDTLFIVDSTDGYSKLLERLSRSPDLVRPINNSLLDGLNSEFAEIKQLSDFFFQETASSALECQLFMPLLGINLLMDRLVSQVP